MGHLKRTGGGWSGRHMVLLITAVWMMSSCGYRFAGGDAAPFGVRKIAVLMFENRTSEVGVESIFTNDFIDVMTNDGRISVVEPSRAEGVFKGVISAVEIDTISRRSSYLPLERRVTIVLDVAFEDEDGRVLWSGKEWIRTEEYTISPDKRVTERNRRAAISEISEQTAREIYQMLTWVGS
ncbi:MAG: LptE family protein [Desulfobacterales bacterium]